MKNAGAKIAWFVGLVATLLAVGAFHVRSSARTENVVEGGEIHVPDGKLKAARDRVAVLEREAAAESNRADTAEAKYRDEKEANEPLRKQIEKMIGEKIVLAAELGKKQEMQKAIHETPIMTDTDVADLESKLSDTEEEKARLGEELESLRKELKEKQPAEPEKAKSRFDELNKIIEILQIDKRPDENVDSSTNESEDVKGK